MARPRRTFEDTKSEAIGLSVLARIHTFKKQKETVNETIGHIIDQADLAEYYRALYEKEKEKNVFIVCNLPDALPSFPDRPEPSS